MANVLTYNFEETKKENYKSLLKDCHRMGIQFLPADANASEWGFTVEDDKLRIGFCAIKGFGKKVVADLIAHRPYEYVNDVIEKTEGRTFNAKAINIAIFSGIFDSISVPGEDRRTTYEGVLKAKDDVAKETALAAGRRYNRKPTEPKDVISVSRDMSIDTHASYDELELTFCTVSFLYSPMQQFESFGWDDLNVKQKFTTKGYITGIRTHKAKNGEMAFVTMVTGDGEIDVTVFANTYKNVRDALAKGVVEINATKDGDTKCILNSLKRVAA